MWSATSTRLGRCSNTSREYERLGMYTLREEVLCYLAELGCRAGSFASAASYAAEAAETVAESGMAASQVRTSRPVQPSAAASILGHVEASVGSRRRGSNSRTRTTTPSMGLEQRRPWLLELSLDVSIRCMSIWLAGARLPDRMDPAEPGVIPCVSDEIEALIALGRTDVALTCCAVAARARAEDRPGPWRPRCGARGRSRPRAANWTAADMRWMPAMVHHARARSRSRPLHVDGRGVVEVRAKQKRAAASSSAMRSKRSTHSAHGRGRPRAGRVVAHGGDRDSADGAHSDGRSGREAVAEGRTNRGGRRRPFVNVTRSRRNSHDLPRAGHPLPSDLIRTSLAGRPTRRAHRVFPIPRREPALPSAGVRYGTACREGESMASIESTTAMRRGSAEPEAPQPGS